VTGGRDEQTRTPTETDEEDESTPTTERVDLRDASVVADVTIEGQEYLVLDDLPNGASGEYAYTTADYKLLEPTRATDVAVSYEYCDGYIAGGEDRLEYTNEQHAELDEIERWARTANILALLGGAVALAKINPVGSLTKVAELASQTLDWAQQDINEPYKEQYLKIAAQSSTLDWIDEEAPEPGDSLSAFDLVDGGTDLVQLSLETYEAVDSMDDLVQASSTVSSVLSRADSIRTDVDPSSVSGISDLRHTGYTVLTSLAVNATVSSIANVAEVQAKSAALGGGSAGARRPILNELVTLEERVRECNIGPSGILQIQALKQVDYQMEAAAWAGIADLYEGLSDSRLGLGYDAVLETDEFAQTARQNAEGWEELSHYVMAGTGQYLDQGRERYSESFNNDQYGEQPVLGNS